MKMKRYFAADARQALRELREEQGPDAVILSNRKVPGGVEIIAALDYDDALINSSFGNPHAASCPYPADLPGASSAPADNRQPSARTVESQRPAAVVEDFPPVHQNSNESTNPELCKIQQELKGLRSIMEAPLMKFAWGDMERVQPLQANLMKRLMTLGLSSKLCEKITEHMAQDGMHQHSWLESLKLLANVLPVAKNNDVMTKGGVIALVGPTGVGKTTTVAKLAAHFALRHGRRSISLVTTDSYRIGAHEQLRTYGRILGVPVQIAADMEELATVLQHNRDKKLTLIDTAGMSQKDKRLASQLSMLNIDGIPIETYLVISATAQMQLQNDVIRSFGGNRLKGCILTKTDEAASLGEVISLLIQNKLPVAFVGNGQRVPDDLRPARGKELVREAVQLMQQASKAPSDEVLAYMFGGMVANAAM